MNPYERLYDAVLKEGVKEGVKALRLHHRVLIERTPLIEDLFAGRAERDREAAVGVARCHRALAGWREAREFFRPGSEESTLELTCSITGRDVGSVRASVAEWMNLPWNGLRLQGVLDAYVATSRAAAFYLRRYTDA